MSPSEVLYQEVLSHYQACFKDRLNISDTWVHTLEQKGSVFAIQEMIDLRKPDNKASAFSDHSYLLDATAIDLKDSLHLHLLSLGESDFGSPRKDANISDRSFSSLFLREVLRAAHIIRLLKKSGITEPTVMEIGSGLGLMQYLLRRYFGPSITQILVDLPETLFVQEWYLRNCLPNVSFSFKASSENFQVVPRGINFVNAHVIDSQNLPFDLAININSMQEMTSQTAHRYIRYIEKNITQNGLFVFQNHYGHSTDSVAEPSEYDLDAYWTIESAWITHPIENCSEDDMARFVFRRSEGKTNVGVRKLVLRVIWNGSLSGVLQKETEVSDLTAASEAPHSSDAVATLERVLKKHRIPIDVSHLSRLERHVYLPRNYYIHCGYPPTSALYGSNSHAGLSLATRRAQAQLTALMARIGNPSIKPALPFIAQAVDRIGTELLKNVESPLRSEYWSAYLACILLPLGQRQSARSLLTECALWSDNAHWLVRFAHLLGRYGYFADALEILDKLSERTRADIYVAIKSAELRFLCEDHDGARRAVAGLMPQCERDPKAAELLVIAALRIGVYQAVRELCCSLSRSPAVGSRQSLLDVLISATSFLPTQSVAELADDTTIPSRGEKDPPAITARYGVLMLKLGNREAGLPLVQDAIGSFNGSHYGLAWLGKLLQQTGYCQLADYCFQQSVALRPGNFLHHEFIGDGYLSVGRVDKALEHFDMVLSINPTLWHLRGKFAYCGLHNTVRESGIFGDISELEMIFQRRQSFYGVGPTWKY